MSNSCSRSYGHQLPAIFVSIWMIAVYGTSKFHCPPMVELGTSVNLTCNVNGTSEANSYTTPGGNTAAACSLSDGDCIPTGIFTASVINTTSSVLTIPKTLKTHGGVWKCVDDADDPNPVTCHMSVVKLPTCEITSDQDISSLTEGATLTLSVNLTSSFCSGPSRISLRTGRVSTTLVNGTGTDIIPNAWTKEFTVTSSRFGDVRVMLTCRDDSRNVSCTGVKELVEDTLSSAMTSSTLPTDSPSSDGPSTETSDSDLSWIAGIIVPILIISIIIIIIIRYLYKTYNNRTTSDDNPIHSPEETHQMVTTSVARRDDLHEVDEQ